MSTQLYWRRISKEKFPLPIKLKWILEENYTAIGSGIPPTEYLRGIAHTLSEEDRVQIENLIDDLENGTLVEFVWEG